MLLPLIKELFSSDIMCSFYQMDINGTKTSKNSFSFSYIIKEVTFIVFDLGYVFISLEPTNQEKTLFTRQKAVKFAVGGCCCCCYSRWGSS